MPPPPPATRRALFPGFTIRPFGDGPLLVALASGAPPGLLGVLQAFFPVEEAPPGDLPGEGEGPDPRLVTPTWAWCSTSTRTTSTSSASRPPPPPPPAVPTRHQGGGGGPSAQPAAGHPPPPRPGLGPSRRDSRGGAAPVGHDLAPPGSSVPPHTALLSPLTACPRLGPQRTRTSMGHDLAPFGQRGAQRTRAPCAHHCRPSLTSPTHTAQSERADERTVGPTAGQRQRPGEYD